MELSHAGPAWWRTTTAETREKAAIPPVYRPLSRTRNVEKATWFSVLSVFPFPGACFLVSWFCGCSWPLAFCSGSVCGSGRVVWFLPSCVVCFRPPVCFKEEATTQSFDRYLPTIYLAVGLAFGIRITLYCLSFGRCGVTGTVCCGSGSFYTVLGVHGWLQMVIIDIVVPKIDIFAFSTGRFNIIALDGHLFEDMMATCHRHNMLWRSRVGTLQRQVWNC